MINGDIHIIDRGENMYNKNIIIVFLTIFMLLLTSCVFNADSIESGKPTLFDQGSSTEIIISSEELEEQLPEESEGHLSDELEDATGMYKFLICYNGSLYERTSDGSRALLGIDAHEVPDKCLFLGTIDVDKTVGISLIPTEELSSNFAQRSFDIYQYDENNKKIMSIEDNSIALWKLIDEDDSRNIVEMNPLLIYYDDNLYVGPVEEYSMLLNITAEEIADKGISLGTVEADKTVSAGIVPTEDFSSNFAQSSFDIYKYDSKNNRIATAFDGRIQIWDMTDTRYWQNIMRYSGR